MKRRSPARVAILGAALLLSGCGTSGTASRKPAPTATRTATASPTATTATASPTAVASASLAPAASTNNSPIPPSLIDAVFVGPLPSNDALYQVSIVRSNGTVAASAQAHRPTDRVGTPTPLVSTSRTRVYFLDGDGRVVSLAPDGKMSAVTTLPMQPQVHATFAVSPDDRRIAVSSIDYSLSPPQLRLYVEDINRSNHVEIFTSTSLYVWPVGWHAGNLVVAVGDAYPLTQPHAEAAHPWCLPSFVACVADNPYSAVHGYHLVDPSNGNRIATLGSDKCQVIGLLTAAGSICREGEFPGGVTPQLPSCRPTFTACMRLADWNGIISDWIQIQTIWIGAMTPDGSRIATCCNYDSLEVYARSAGAAGTKLRSGAAPQGWLDSDYLMFQPLQTETTTIRRIGSDTEANVNAPGIPVALIPGGF